MSTALEKLLVAGGRDFGRFAFEGFGIRLSDDQLEAFQRLGRPGPRQRGERKFAYLSGGQRSGKTVEGFLWHAHACIYKTGVDNSSNEYWRNYIYRTLACGPTEALALKLYVVGDEIQKGVSDAQFDKRKRRSRAGLLTPLFKAGKSGVNALYEFKNGSYVDFRSTEGSAYRLEGDKWWFITWDEWASQPDYEIAFIRTEVLMGRSRDHDAKIVLMAWPKAKTERHLIEAIRGIEAGTDPDSQVIYLSAADAHFSNQSALALELRTKSPAQWKRTVLGEPAGGAAVEFKEDVTANLFDAKLPMHALWEPGYRYLNAWDIGLAHDDTVGLSFRVPIAGPTPKDKVRIVDHEEMRGGSTLSLDAVCFGIAKRQMLFQCESVLDATGLGGVAAVRQLQELNPRPYGFVAKSQHRIYGNMRNAAIANAIEMLTWGRVIDEVTKQEVPGPWGLVESPRIVRLVDQLANFDRDAKNVPDDWVWAFLIGLWYIRRWWVVERRDQRALPFDLRSRRDTTAQMHVGGR